MMNVLHVWIVLTVHLAEVERMVVHGDCVQ